MTPHERGICPLCKQETTIYYLDEGADVGDALVLCEDCAVEEGWEQCAICGDFYPVDLVEFTIVDDRFICEYCVEDFPDDEEEQDEENDE